MSNEGDQTVFYNSVTDTRDQSNDILFNDKNYTFITDTTSSNGSFQSGQMSFDLSTLSSQSQWVSLSEAVIEFPIKVSTVCSGTVTSVTPAADFITLKNGFHNFIDGCQLIINGTTVQSTQPYENVAATFRILSEWSQDTLVKYGRTTAVILDDCTGDATASSTDGLNNAANTAATSALGFNAYDSAVANKAQAARTSMISDITGTSTLQSTILGNAAIKTEGRHNMAYGANTTGILHEVCYLATVRLRDICDVSQFPLVKNLKGFLYLSFNSSQTTYKFSAASTFESITTIPLTGRTCPIMQKAGGLTGGAASNSVIVTATVNSDGNNLGNCGPVISNARMLVPYYISNPKADMALSMPNKYFVSKEKIVVPITVSAGQPANVTLTSGVQNPVGLVMLPMWQNLGQSSYSSPEISPFDSAPGTSGPFAALANLQVYVANKPCYQNPVQYSFEQWYQENLHTGLADGLVDAQSSGLLTEQLWTQNHRFYYVDLSRRAPSADGASSSVQVSFQNPCPNSSPNNFGLKVICIVFYEKKWTINTMTSQITSAI